MTRWLGVYRWRPAALLLILVAAAALFVGGLEVKRLGPGYLSRPTALLLALCAIAGVAVAIAAKPPPMPPRFRNVKGFLIAHFLWSCCALVAGVLACWAGAVSAAGNVSALATARNVLLFAAMATTLAAFGPLWLAWIGPATYMFAALQFGSPNGSTVSTWAVVINPQATISQVALGGIFAVTAWAILASRALGAVGYAVKRRP